MAVAETAKLIVDLSLTGNYGAQLTKAQRGFAGLGKSITNTQGRAYKAGQQIGTGIQRGALIAVSALGALTGLLALSVKEGAEAGKVQTIYAKAIANSGKVSAAYVKVLDAQQKALMNLGGVDDELIKTSQTRLIQMGLTGKQVAKATPLILDFAKATGIDLLAATKLVGKATNGNAGALKRYGIEVDKAKFKTDPFATTMEALNKKFGGTTKALSGDLPTRLAAFHEALANIREDAGQKLLPVLTKIVDVAGKDLVPAFGKFVDRIMPAVLEGLNQFSDLLANGGAERGINAITDALGPMVELVKVAAAPVKAIVGAFLALPKEVQTVLVGAFAVNKLTGGLVTNVAGGLVEGLAKAVIGGIKAPLVNVQGGVVNVAGGVGGVPGVTPVGKGGGLTSVLKTGAQVVIPVAIAAVTARAAADLIQPGLNTAVDNGTQLAQRDPRRFNANGQVVANTLGELKKITTNTSKIDAWRMDVVAAVGRVEDSFDRSVVPVVGAVKGLKGDLGGVKTTVAGVGTAVGAAATKTAMATQIAGIASALGTSAAGIMTASAARGAGERVAGAIASKDLSVDVMTNVTVNVSASSVTKQVVIQKRYGPANGSAAQDGSGVLHNGAN